MRKKYARVATQLKNICFFVSLATIPALKMTHLLLAGCQDDASFASLCLLLSQEINDDNSWSRVVGKSRTKTKNKNKNK